MHRTYQRYDPKTGRIFSTVTVAEDIAGHMRAQGETLIEGEGNDLEHFVDVSISPPKIRERQKQTTRQDKKRIKADGEDVCTISALPKPCILDLNGERIEVGDGAFLFSTVFSSVYQIRVEAFPWQDWIGEIMAE